MANTESSHADRLGRADQLHEELEQMDPPFAPADDSLLPANIATTIADTRTQHQETEALFTDYSTAVRIRKDFIKNIFTRAMRAIYYLKSSSAFDYALPEVNKAYKALRGYRLRRITPPPANPPAQPRRNTGEQSYADIHSLLLTFVEKLSKVDGYLPPHEEIQLATIIQLADDLGSMNRDMIAQDSALDHAVRVRHHLFYDKTDGLRSIFRRSKQGVIAQYGRNSPQYEAVRGIKF